MTNSFDTAVATGAAAEANLAGQVIDLQSRVAFQEDALQEMSRQMALQTQALQAAQQQIQLLNQKINDLFYQMEQKSADLMQERPPHY